MEYITRNNYVIKHDCDSCIHDSMCKYRDVIDDLETIADKFEEYKDINLTGEIKCEMYMEVICVRGD